MTEIITGPSGYFAQQQQQPDVIGNLSHLLALKQQQQLAPLQLQEAQQQVQSGQLDLQNKQRQQDSDASIMKAYQDSGGDLGKTIESVSKSGKVLPQAMAQLRQAHYQVQQEAYKLLQEKGARAIQEADLADGAADTVKAAPPEQRPAIYQQQLQTLAQQGVDVSQIPQQYPGDQAFTGISLGLKSHKAALDAAAKKAETDKSVAQTQEAQSQTALNQMEVQRGGKTETDKFTSDFLQSHGLANTPENRQKAFKEYTKETKIAPAEVRMSALLQMPTEVADPNNPGETIMVKRNDAVGMKGRGSASTQAIKAEDKYMTSGKGAQQLTAFNTAMQHLDLLEKLGGDLQNSNLQIANKAKQSWAAATGNPAPANFEAAKNAMSGEVAAALKASGATDKEIEKVDGTFGRAQSPMQLKGAIAVYRTLLRSKAHNLQVQFQQGMQGKPAFGNDESAPASAPSGGGDPFAQFGGKAH